MVTERVAYLEGRVEEHSNGIRLLTARIDALGERLDTRIDALGVRLDALGVRLDARIDALDQKVDRLRDDLTRRMNFQFYWLMGVQVTMFVTIVTILTMR